jgi:hypothetical protein
MRRYYTGTYRDRLAAVAAKLTGTQLGRLLGRQMHSQNDLFELLPKSGSVERQRSTRTWEAILDRIFP